MIIIRENALAKAAEAIAECITSARGTNGSNLGFLPDDKMIRRGILALIGHHHDLESVSVLPEGHQAVHVMANGDWISFPPLEGNRPDKTKDRWLPQDSLGGQS